jgi:hypothetical protein
MYMLYASSVSLTLSPASPLSIFCALLVSAIQESYLSLESSQLVSLTQSSWPTSLQSMPEFI